MSNSSDIACELNGARYQIQGLLRELTKVENDEYFSLKYVMEKLDHIAELCKAIDYIRNDTNDPDK